MSLFRLGISNFTGQYHTIRTCFQKNELTFSHTYLTSPFESWGLMGRLRICSEMALEMGKLSLR